MGKIFILFKAVKSQNYIPHYIHGVYNSLEEADQKGRELIKEYNTKDSDEEYTEKMVCWVEEHQINEPGSFTFHSCHVEGEYEKQ